MTNRTQALLDALHTLELQDAELSALKKHHQKEVQLILAERDRTFSLMLDRAQSAEAKLAIAVEALEDSSRLINALQEVAYHSADTYEKAVVYADDPASAALAKIEGESK